MCCFLVSNIRTVPSPQPAAKEWLESAKQVTQLSAPVTNSYVKNLKFLNKTKQKKNENGITQ